jgi:hypothetical protein
MIIINDEYVTLDTPSGPMRTHIVRPAAPGRYPASSSTQRYSRSPPPSTALPACSPPTTPTPAQDCSKGRPLEVLQSADNRGRT